MTKTIFKSKITIPVLMSFTVAILFVLATPPAFAGHFFDVTPSSIQTGPIGVTQTFTFDANTGSAHWTFRNINGCPFPAADFVTITSINSPPPSGADVLVNSGVPGTFECVYVVESHVGRAPHHDATLRITAIFEALPADTCNDDLATCNDDLATAQDDLAICNGNLATCNDDLVTCEGDLGVCEADNVTLNQQIIDLQAIITGLQSAIDDLQSEIQNLLDILLSGEITICHKEKVTQTIGLDAFGKHAGHGDTIGAC